MESFDMGSADTDPRELVDLGLDGALDASDRATLESRVAADPTLQREQQDLGRVHELLVAGRVTARPGFVRDVMAALPELAPWAKRPLAGWRSALAALAALLVVAMGLLGVAGARIHGSPGLAALRAVADFATAAMLSGAGLLAASWRGVGLAVAEALDVPATVVFGLGVIAVNALLVVLLRRAGSRRRATATATVRRRS